MAWYYDFVMTVKKVERRTAAGGRESLEPGAEGL